MKYFISLLLLLNTSLSLPVFAELKVYDLGDIEVDGDIRKPQVSLIERNQEREQYFNQLAQKSFTDLESQLLKPFSIDVLIKKSTSKKPEEKKP